MMYLIFKNKNKVCIVDDSNTLVAMLKSNNLNYIKLKSLPKLQESDTYDFDGKNLTTIKKSSDLLLLEAKAKKRIKYAQIDQATRLEISKGFLFDGQRFSLSENAQRNWQRLSSLHNASAFKDQEISTKEQGNYLLTKAKIKEFIKVESTTIAQILKIGRDKKQLL